MKRRDFLIGTGAAVGMALPAGARAQARPCPPDTLSVTGGTSVNTACSNTGAADWLARSSAPGVIWSHDFETDSEVDQFRWTGGYGNDPGRVAAASANCRRNTNDHPSGAGACLEINIPTGGQSGSAWWRPMSALAAGSSGNGKSAPDAAAGGSLSRRVYAPTSPSVYERFSTGYYGHPDYQSAYPTWPTPAIQSAVQAYSGPQNGIWDGSSFYIQFRVKVTGGRANANNPGGKLLFLSNTYRSNPANEIVVRSRKDMLFDLYTSNGNYQNSFLTNPQGAPNDSTPKQPGYNESTCQYASPAFGGIQSGCWFLDIDRWNTVLMRVVPGRAGNPGWANWPVTSDNLVPPLQSQLGGANANTVIECWAARSGEQAYTKIWSKSDYVFAYGVDGNPHPPGFNAVIASGFMNGDGTTGANAVEGWQQRYSQFIFSRDFIPCPRA